MKDEIDRMLSEPRVESRGEMFMAGLKERHAFTDAAGIPLQWQRFSQAIANMPGKRGDDAYGVTFNVKDGGFDYLCAVETHNGVPPPDKFEMLRLAPLAWAMFHYEGHVSGIRGAWERIWSFALRDAGLQAVDAPCVERYGASFDPRSGTGGFELWVPVHAD